MERKRLILFVMLAFVGVCLMHAYKMRVYVRDAVGTRLKCKSIYATDKSNIFIEDGEYCASDTSFLFKSLPEIPLLIKTTIDNDTEDFWVGGGDNDDDETAELYVILQPLYIRINSLQN